MLCQYSSSLDIESEITFHIMAKSTSYRGTCITLFIYYKDFIIINCDNCLITKMVENNPSLT